MKRSAPAIAGLMVLLGCAQIQEHEDTATPVDMGLVWLHKHQEEDGSWDADGFMKHCPEGSDPCTGTGSAVHDVGVTALALMAFLGDGNTMRSGPYQDVVKSAVMWLRDQQADDGLYGTNTSHDFIYDHALAALAMVQAYGLSDFKLLKRYAQGGIDYLESHRNPYAVWRYQPRDGDNDTSVTSWAVQAYRAAMDFDLEVNFAAMENASLWLDEVTDSSGRAGYSGRGERSSRDPGDHARRFPPERGEALTAAALLSRFALGQDPGADPIMIPAADRILEHPPLWDPDAGTIDHYYWYYATQALHLMGGAWWTAWSRQLVDAVAPTQRVDSDAAGSWDPIGVWGEHGGRVYSTAMMVLAMEQE